MENKLKTFIISYSEIKRIEIKAETIDKASELFVMGEFDENDTESFGIDCEHYNIRET